MLKDKLITRTISATTANVLCVELNAEQGTGETLNKAFTIPEKSAKDNETILKYVVKNFATDTLKPVAIVSTETVSTLRGCTETEFLKYATTCDTRKGLNLEGLVTKTVSTMAVSALRVNIEKANTFNETIYISTDHTKDEQTALKYINRNYDNDNYKTVSLKFGPITENVVYMTVSQFVAISKELPARDTDK